MSNNDFLNILNLNPPDNKSFTSEGADDRGFGVAGAEGEAKGRGGEVEGEEPEGEEESGDEEGDGRGEAEESED